MEETMKETNRIDYKQLFPWVHLFRAFRIALDPRKLILAGLALLALSGGEKVFSYLPFWPSHSVVHYQRTGGTLEIRTELHEEWEEPFHFEQLNLSKNREGFDPRTFFDSPVNTLLSAAANGQVILRPMRDLVFSVSRLFEGNLSWEASAVAWTRLLWFLLVWSLFGGAITRSAAVQFARDQTVGLIPALKFSGARYLSFLSAPFIAVGFLGVLWSVLAVGGWIGRIPGIGDGLVALFWIIPLLIGLVMALVLIGGLPGWPLMYATISTEDSDAFDGFSRSYSYVYSRPWHYLWYAVVSMVYGSVVIIFFTTAASLVAYLASWGVSSGRGVEGILQASSSETFPGITKGLWMQFWAILVLGFVYSYFWTSVTIMYFLLRQSEDAVELDVVCILEPQASEEEMPLVGVAASEQPVVERPAKDEAEDSATEEK